jgi:hypothetical protein
MIGEIRPMILKDLIDAIKRIINSLFQMLKLKVPFPDIQVTSPTAPSPTNPNTANPSPPTPSLTIQSPSNPSETNPSPSPTTVPSPIDCKLGPWMDNGCSTSNKGKKIQIRNVLTPAANGGAVCGPLSQEVDDTTTCPIPIDCQWGPWVDGQCLDQTQHISKTQTRTKAVLAKSGGADCTGSTTQTVDDPVKCPLIVKDCVWGP